MKTIFTKEIPPNNVLLSIDPRILWHATFEVQEIIDQLEERFVSAMESKKQRIANEYSLQIELEKIKLDYLHTLLKLSSLKS